MVITPCLHHGKERSTRSASIPGLTNTLSRDRDLWSPSMIQAPTPFHLIFDYLPKKGLKPEEGKSSERKRFSLSSIMVMHWIEDLGI